VVLPWVGTTAGGPREAAPAGVPPEGVPAPDRPVGLVPEWASPPLSPLAPDSSARPAKMSVPWMGHTCAGTLDGTHLRRYHRPSRECRRPAAPRLSRRSPASAWRAPCRSGVLSVFSSSSFTAGPRAVGLMMPATAEVLATLQGVGPAPAPSCHRGPALSRPCLLRPPPS
jgi:hypothetical protein